MASYGRKRRSAWSSRYYGRYGRRNWVYSSRSKRRAIGNQKAANQQKDAATVNLSIQHKCSTSYIKKDINGDKFNTGVYALNIWDLLRKSEFYQSYAGMYDQVKIERIKLKLTPTQWTFTSNGANSVQALTICTAWDRTGLSDEQVKLIKNNVAISGDNMGVIGTSGNTDGLYTNLNEDICTYSSAQTKNLNPGSSCTIVRYLYPSSLIEKSCYVNTADLDSWYSEFDKTGARYYGINGANMVIGNPASFAEYAQDVILGELRRSPEIDSNPCFLLEDTAVAFKPTFLIGLVTNKTQAEIEASDDSTIIPPLSFNVEADVVVTFRGLRKARIVE